jgi:phosphoglycolate phosphatase-like HAD superfamily hydrolase
VNKLVVFDIDGTLTDTIGVDDECYREAIAAALDVAADTVDWSGAAHVTDAGIFEWLCARHGRPIPAAGAVAETRDRFVERLKVELANHPDAFTAIPGARAALASLDATGWRMAVATGGWGPSARMKLQAAHLSVDDAVLACADDATARADIVQLAMARAERFYGCRFDRVVVLGDARWDVDAAALLGLPFIGIASEARASMLHAAGAHIVLADYSDIDTFHAALSAARAPTRSDSLTVG